MKKKLIGILVAVVLLFSMVTVYSDTKSEVKSANDVMNKGLVMYIGSPVAYLATEEKMIDPENQSIVPYIKGGSTFVPVRFACEVFGGTVAWDKETQTVAIRTKNKTISVTVGQEAELAQGRVSVPIRFIAESLNREVFYDRGLIVIGDGAASLDKVKDKADIDALINEFTGIKTLGSKAKLVELLGYDPSIVPVSSGDEIYEVVMDAAPMALVKSSETPVVQAESDYSETNVQVQGVDEADIIKTDGQYIYYVRGQVISIVKVNDSGNPEKMSDIKTDSNFSFREIFIDGDKVIAIGEYYNSVNPSPYLSNSRMTSGYSASYTKAIVYDTSNKKSPKLEREIEVKGNYASARKIDSSIYFISNSRIYGPEILPVYKDSATQSKETIIDYKEICYLPIEINNSFTSITGFNTESPDEPANIETFLGCGENIYMSERNLYIAGTSYEQGSQKTNIYKYAMDSGNIVFVRNGSVPGYVLNQFSMDEHNSYFRIATHAQNYNNLYVLDNMLNITGTEEKIAPGERIYSVRFMGDRAYMVTFKQVDPLFAIDLSDPQNPEVLGALKIPGYSNYLHPYDENHLIGFGKDTTLDQYGNAYYLGMKMSLFDVTDVTNPKEMFVETIGTRGTDSPLLSDHKALLFSKDKGLLAFPVQVYKSSGASSNSGVPAYGTFEFAGAYVYDISLDKGFSLKGKLTHMSAQDMLKSSGYGGDYDKYIERILYIGNDLYTASQSKIMVNTIHTLEQRGSLEL